jgi:alkylation response protein AidB-like acyl-CoA dehydrogenase
MTQSILPGTGPWSWLEPGLWVYRSRELDLLGQADGLLADAVPAAQQGGAALLEAKRRLHAAGVGAATAPAAVGGGGHRYVVQVGIQFLAGYRDLTLRDVAHVGHGALLAQDPDWHGRSELAAVIRGALLGLATTEPATDPQGEEELAAVTTRAVRTRDGWEISGRKAWVSRVLEADAFVVFARSPEHLGAFYLPAGAPGLTPEPAPRPDGAEAGRGWSWGDLVLDKVPVPPTAVLGASVGGVAVFRRHLADYRPLVAATCLGAAAAAVDDWVERVLAAPNAGSGLPDRVVERLGDLRGRVLLALGGLFTGAAGPGAIDSSWSKMAKAQAVNTAIEVVRAVVTQMESVPGGVPADALAAVRRVRAELTAFEAADGARAPLLRSAGERFVQYSAAILDEISEPTSTMPRPRLSD